MYKGPKHPKWRFNDTEMESVVSAIKCGKNLGNVLLNAFKKHMVYLRFCNSPSREWQSICVGFTPFALYPLVCNYEEIVSPSFKGFAVQMGFVGVTVERLSDPTADEDAVLVFKKYCPDLAKCVFSTLEKMIKERLKSGTRITNEILTDDTLTLARRADLKAPEKAPTTEERLKHVEENDTLLFDYERKEHEVHERETLEQAWSLIGILVEQGYVRSVIKEDSADLILRFLSLDYITDYGDGLGKFLKPFQVSEHIEDFEKYVHKIWQSLQGDVDRFDEWDAFADFDMATVSRDEKCKFLILLMGNKRIHEICTKDWKGNPELENPFQKMVEYYGLPEGPLPV
jgi:hypothetical protein